MASGRFSTSVSSLSVEDGVFFGSSLGSSLGGMESLKSSGERKRLESGTPVVSMSFACEEVL